LINFDLMSRQINSTNILSLICAPGKSV